MDLQGPEYQEQLKKFRELIVVIDRNTSFDDSVIRITRLLSEMHKDLLGDKFVPWHPCIDFVISQLMFMHQFLIEQEIQLEQLNPGMNMYDCLLSTPEYLGMLSQWSQRNR